MVQHTGLLGKLKICWASRKILSVQYQHSVGWYNNFFSPCIIVINIFFKVVFHISCSLILKICTYYYLLLFLLFCYKLYLIFIFIHLCKSADVWYWRKSGPIWRKKVFFHHDNALAQKSAIATPKLFDLRYEILPHPPYSPDLAPSDYFLFPNVKTWLGGKDFHRTKRSLLRQMSILRGLIKINF